MKTAWRKAVILVLILAVSIACFTSCQLPATSTPSTIPTTSPSAEIEAAEFMGVPLTPIVQQQTNALKGTQFLDRETYRLKVDGLVERPLSLSYDDLLAYPQVSKLNILYCVDGWDFTAKFTGPEMNSVFAAAGLKPGASIAIFYTADAPEGYTSLEVAYLRESNIMLALKINDITLPPERGFPFQVIAEAKFGYKWAKWVTRIELSADTGFRGYWESLHYNNDASVSGPRTEP